MAYTIEIVDSLHKTIGKFVTLNNYQLAGHLANLDFWLGEVNHAIAVLDGYDQRQRVMERTQREYIGKHDTRRFTAEETRLADEFPNDECEALRSAKPDQYRLDASLIQAKRRDLVNALYAFLQRCHKERLINGSDAKVALCKCHISAEPGHFVDEA